MSDQHTEPVAGQSVRTGGLRPKRHRTAAAAAVAIAAGACAAAADASSNGDGPPGCGPAGARTYAESDRVRVYRVRSSRDRQPMVACSKRTGRTHPIDDPDGDDTAFPVVAANGWWVAYALNVVDGDDVSTVVGLLDERRFGQADIQEVAGVGVADEGDRAKVGSIVVNAQGSVAWISCESDAVYARVGPDCLRGGAPDRVWRRALGHRRRLLDEGRRIDPSSLRLRGTRIRWTNDGQRRKAKLE